MSKADKWTALVKEYRTSGKSQRVWCADNGVKRSTLRYRIERLDELSEGEDVKFAEIEIGGDRIC